MNLRKPVRGQAAARQPRLVGLQNRDLLHPGMGCDRCLRIIRRHAPDALLINQHAPPAFRLAPWQAGPIAFTVTPPKTASPGLRVLTADVSWENRDLRSWTEALLRIGN